MQVADRELQLDAVRGCAILLAMGWHLNQQSSNPIARVLLYPGLAFGWAGVDLFFVLSGFLVGGLVLREIKRTGDFRAPRFFVRRAMRLWPVLYVYLAAKLISGVPWAEFLPQIFFHVQNYFRTPMSHLWSLAVEEHFYLLMGLAMPWLARPVLNPRRLMVGLIVLIVVTTIVRSAAWYAGVDRVSLQWQTHYRVDVLALGVLLAVIDVYYPAIFMRIKKPWPLWLIGMAIGIGILILIRPDITRWRGLIGFPAAALASASFLLLVHRRPIPGWLKPAIRPVAWLGIYSYSIYIWHVGVGRQGGAKLARMVHHDTPEVRVIFGYACAIAVAFVVTKLVEHPAMKLRDRLFPSARSQTKAEQLVDSQEGAPRAAV